MKVKKRLEFIEAMKILLAKYVENEGKKPGGDSIINCPLCKVAGCTTGINPDCNICPWVVFTGKTCIQNTISAMTRYQRISDLAQWIEKYENASDYKRTITEMEPFEVTFKFDDPEEVSFLINIFGQSNEMRSGRFGGELYEELIKELSSQNLPRLSPATNIAPFWPQKNGGVNYWDLWVKYWKEQIEKGK